VGQALEFGGRAGLGCPEGCPSLQGGSLTDAMKKVHREELIKSGHFERLRALNSQFIAGMIQRESANTMVNRRYAYGECLRSHLSNGCIALILGEGDDEARKNFEATVEYALKLVGAPPTPGGGVRIYEANVEFSEQGSRLTSLHEKKPQPGEEKLSITEYHRALICVGCFGEPSQFGVIASVPEEAYQDPGTVASSDYWAHVRAWKALLLGKEAEARREAQIPLSRGSGSIRPEAAAMLALLDGDEGRFNRNLEDAVRLYVKATSKQVNDPITAVFFPGLMLSRMALERGLAVEDGSYLPVRLLPNFKARYPQCDGRH